MIETIKLLENDINSFSKPLEQEMVKPIEHFVKELIKIRTGRAHTSLIESIMVEVYGQQPIPLKGLAVLSAPEPRLLTIQPWDMGTIAAIEKAIRISDLGVNPVNDGKIIRISLPEMSSQRRDDLVKILGQKLEECKIAIRNVRNKFNNLLRDAKKDKIISENFISRLQDVLAKITEQTIKTAEQKAEQKKIDITSI